MAEEVKTPQEEEVKIPEEGTVEAEIAKNAVKEGDEVVVDDKTGQTVPLSAFLDLKKDLKELRKEIKDSSDTKKSSVTVNGVKELAEKYPGVSQEFIEDILNNATKNAATEIDNKYTPIIQKQEAAKAKEAFDNAFDKVFDKALADNADLPKNIDKELVKTLALTPAYKNTPISEILTKLYPEGVTGKGSSENEARNAADHVDDVVNFDKITPEQKAKVLADPEARKKYFNYLDTK